MAAPSEKTAEKLRELCRLRSTLESFAVARLRESPRRVEICAALRKQMRRLKSAATKGLYEDFHREDMQLHRLVVEAPALPALVECWNTVSAEIDAWILQVKIVHWPSLMALYREHEFLLDAWDSSDPAAAERATHHHLEAGWYRAVMAQETLPPEGNAVDRAASFLSTHYASPIDIRWMAQHICFVSPSHLTRLFRQQFQLPPYMWLRQVRLDRAAELLTATGHPITDVARQVGYRNVSHFVRDFRAAHGITPAKFRQAKRA